MAGNKRAKRVKVQHLELDPKELIDWDKNPRHNDAAATKLAELLKLHGFIDPIIVDQNMIIRAGHTRKKAAIKAGIKKVPVILVKFKSEKEAEAFAIANNRSQEWSAWDKEELFGILSDLENTLEDFESTGFSILEKTELEMLMEAPDIDVEDRPEPGERIHYDVIFETPEQLDIFQGYLKHLKTLYPAEDKYPTLAARIVADIQERGI